MRLEPLQASTRFHPHFALPWIRSSGFRSYSRDSRRFNTALLIACEHVAFATGASLRVTLATKIYSPARYSQRTTEPLRALSFYIYYVSGSFNSLLRVLFNFPSRYSCTIGLLTYLELGVDAPRIPTSYPRDGTLELSTSFLDFPTRLSLSLVCLSRQV
jgi:hypothetical protein